MNVESLTLNDVNEPGGAIEPPCIGLTPDALPKVNQPHSAENIQPGVSTRNGLSQTIHQTKIQKIVPHWYALRVTYGRERRAFDYLVEKKVEAYYPTIKIVKIIDGKRKMVEESRLPNIFFARGTEEEIKTFVYDNYNLPFLRFYYRHFHEGSRLVKEPMIIPDYQIEGLKIICASEADDIIIETSEIPKFQKGQTVRVVEGTFKGLIGKVARYQGQQRVALVIDGLLTVASAYVPSAFLEIIQ